MRKVGQMDVLDRQMDRWMDEWTGPLKKIKILIRQVLGHYCCVHSS